jgi:hypothetical protein
VSARDDLAGIAEALDADGYTLEVVDESDTLSLRISAREGACEDCLVPPEIMAPTISAALGGRYTPERIRLQYPK